MASTDILTSAQFSSLNILLARDTQLALVAVAAAPPPEDADPNEPLPPGPVRVVLDGGGNTMRYDIATDGRVRNPPEDMGPHEGDWDTAEIPTS
jgi:hypothetical protein